MTGLFFHSLGMSSSHLTFIFFRGVETTNQIQYICTCTYLGKLLQYRPHCDLSGIMVNTGNYPNIAVFQVSDFFYFAHMYICAVYIYIYDAISKK